MERLTALIADISDPRVGGGDNFYDRLSCRFTVYLLVIFALLNTTRHYVGEPIGCWCPSHFTSSHVDYTNKVCWVTNNYYLPFDKNIPHEGQPRRIIAYYQWVGVFLMVQGVICYLPRPVWRMLYGQSGTGVSVSTVTDAAIECQRKTDPESRKQTLTYMINHMTRFLRELYRLQLMSSPVVAFYYQHFYSNYLTVMYIIVKVLYIANAVGQLYLINTFLGHDIYHWYGWEVVKNLIAGRSWTTSDRFPRVTLCDFKLRVLGHVNRYTVQCALPINLFNEKIYTFLWWWFVLVAIATGLDMIRWIVKILYFPGLVKYVKTKLQAMDSLNHASDEEVRKFTQNYLRRDGILILWLVSENTSDLIASELICGIFTNYRQNPKGLDRLCSRDVVNKNRIKPPSSPLDYPNGELRYRGPNAPSAPNREDIPLTEAQSDASIYKSVSADNIHTAVLFRSETDP